MISYSKESTPKGRGFGSHPKGVFIPAPKEALLVFSRPYLTKNPTGHYRNPIFGIYAHEPLEIFSQFLEPYADFTASLPILLTSNMAPSAKASKPLKSVASFGYEASPKLAQRLTLSP